MILTNRQEEGLKIALQRHKDNEKYTVISGYAGTGKSTLVRFIIDALDVDERYVAYATYTGKAAEVLRKKGNRNAMTLHRLLYDSIPRPGGGFFRKPKQQLDYSIIVVDEVSMVPRSMIEMLLSHNVYALFLGDPFQLPVIDKDETHHLLDHPHVFLDEIMRQAAESEIIQLTMKIRNGEEIPFYNGKETMVIPKKELVTGHLLWASQIICATNKTRFNINNQMRQLLGYSGLPQNGEKIVCLRNQWEDISEDGEAALVNGMTGTLVNPFESFRQIPQYVKVNHYRIEIIQGDFLSEEGNLFNSVELDQKMIMEGEYSLDWRETYTLGRMKNKLGDIAPRQFTFGYAITAWKAQGSEWDKVVALEEQFPFDKIEHSRYLYTVCTRASSKLVLVRNN